MVYRENGQALGARDMAGWWQVFWLGIDGLVMRVAVGCAAIIQWEGAVTMVVAPPLLVRAPRHGLVPACCEHGGGGEEEVYDKRVALCIAKPILTSLIATISVCLCLCLCLWLCGCV